MDANGQDLVMTARHFRALAIALTARDRYTGDHCGRTCVICADMGESCGLSARELMLLHTAAVMHDVGKVAIPDRVLLKPGRLDAAEWAEMRTHSERGEAILLALQVDDMNIVANIVRHHHEGFDGSGYPDGLAGEAIPLLARIIALADSYDAMATERPYHPLRTHAQVMDVIAQEQGAKYDPYLCGKLARIIETSQYRAA